MKFTNLNKIFWPDDKIKKRDLINYYYQVAPYILPYLKGRPQSMNRFPNGITEEGFYFKDVTGKAPEWIERYNYHSDTDKKEKQYLVGIDEATLLYMANLACIEMNPWNSTVRKPDHPTYCIIDLDPDKNTFDQVIETAQVTKQILDDLGVPSYCKPVALPVFISTFRWEINIPMNRAKSLQGLLSDWFTNSFPK